MNEISARWKKNNFRCMAWVFPEKFKMVLTLLFISISLMALPSNDKGSDIPQKEGTLLGWAFLERGDSYDLSDIFNLGAALFGGDFGGFSSMFLYDYEIVREFESFNKKYYLVYEKNASTDEVLNVYAIPQNGKVVKDEDIMPPRVAMLIYHDIGKENEFLGIWVDEPIFDDLGNYKKERKVHELKLDDYAAQMLIDLVTNHSKYKNKTKLEIENFKYKYLYYTKILEDEYYKKAKAESAKVLNIVNMISYPFGIEDETIFTKTIQEVKDQYPDWTFKVFDCPVSVRNWDYTLSVYKGKGYDKTYKSITPGSVEAWWKRGQKRNIVSWRYEFLGIDNSIEEIEDLTSSLYKDLEEIGCKVTKKDLSKEYGDSYVFKRGQSVITLYSSKRGVTLHIDKVKLP